MTGLKTDYCQDFWSKSLSSHLQSVPLRVQNLCRASTTPCFKNRTCLLLLEEDLPGFIAPFLFLELFLIYLVTALCKLPNLLFFWMSHIQRICRNPQQRLCVLDPAGRWLFWAQGAKGVLNTTGLVSPVGWGPGSSPPHVWRSPGCTGWLRNLALGFWGVLAKWWLSSNFELLNWRCLSGHHGFMRWSFFRPAIRFMFQREAAGRMRLLRHWMQLRPTNCNFLIQ